MAKFKLKARQLKESERVVRDEESGQLFLVKPKRKKLDDGTLNARFGF